MALPACLLPCAPTLGSLTASSVQKKSQRSPRDQALWQSAVLQRRRSRPNLTQRFATQPPEGTLKLGEETEALYKPGNFGFCIEFVVSCASLNVSPELSSTYRLPPLAVAKGDG
jgi:hypothetical protein